MERLIRFGIIRLYCGSSGKQGYYNSQEIGLARALKTRGYKCYIFLPDPAITDYQETVIEDNITIVCCPAKTIGVHSRFNWKILKQYNIDYLQIESDNQIFAPDLINYCDKNNIPLYCLVGTIKSSNSSSIKSMIMNVMLNRLLKAYRQHKVFAKTGSVMNELKKHNVSDVELLNIGLDTTFIPEVSYSKQDIRKELDIPFNSTVIMFVGRMESYKKPNRMISLIKDLPDNVYAVMIGDGSLSSKIEKDIIESDLSDRIIWHRKIPNQEVHKYYTCADFFLNSNDEEIYGMSILEAMYQGCSVIAFHAPGPDSIIRSGVNGYLVNDLCEMKEIISERKMLDKDDIKNSVIHDLSWDKSAEKIDELIRCG